MKTQQKRAGFTLVELAIVLVIIGLIVGGVLVGADLIKAATMQKAVKQIGDTETGATTFRTKYSDLPGDLKSPASFFPSITGSLVDVGLGDGNGLIEATTTGVAGGAQTATAGVSGEVGVFYYELSQAGYIKEAMTNVAMGVGSITLSAANQNTGAFLPSALGKGAMLVPSSGNNRNFLLIVGRATGPAVAGVGAFSGGITPLEASNLDAKLDDGNPTRGNLIEVDEVAPDLVTAPLAPGAAGANATTDCYFGTAYNASIGTQECNLAVRTSF